MTTTLWLIEQRPPVRTPLRILRLVTTGFFVLFFMAKTFQAYVEGNCLTPPPKRIPGASATYEYREWRVNHNFRFA
jgi:hypothetical protein